MSEMHGQPGARADPRRLDEELSAGGAVRRDRPLEARARGARAVGRAPDERQSARQRRRPFAGPPAAGLHATMRSRSAAPGAASAEATRVMGTYLRDVMKLNLESRNFRLFSPDENNSNRWQDVLEVTEPRLGRRDRTLRRPSRAGRARHGDAERAPVPRLARGLSPDRPARLLFLLRSLHPHHRLHVQPARQVAEGVQRDVEWRRPIASLNYLLSSLVWRQDHNGFSHQDPGFIDHVINKKAEVVRVYLPPDANCLLSVTDHCLQSRNYVNVDRRRETARAAMAEHGPGDQALHRRPRHLGMGEQRPRRRAGRSDGLLRRRADARDARRCRHLAPARAGAEGPRHQRRRSHAAAAAERASARAVTTATSTHCSPPTSRSSSPSTATLG